MNLNKIWQVIKCYKYYDLVIWSSFQIWKKFGNNANVIEKNTKTAKDPKLGKYQKDPTKKPTRPETEKPDPIISSTFWVGQSTMRAIYFLCWVAGDSKPNPTCYLLRAKIIQCLKTQNLNQSQLGFNTQNQIHCKIS